MFGSGAGAETVDLTDLTQLLTVASTTPLEPSTMKDVVDMESDFENGLITESEALQAVGDLLGAQARVLVVRDLNVQLGAALDAQLALGDGELDDDYEQYLGRMKEACVLLASRSTARSEVLRGLVAQLQADVPTALEAFSTAHDIYRDLDEHVSMTTAEYLLDAAKATQAMAAGDFRSALSALASAQATIEAMLGDTGLIAREIEDEAERAAMSDGVVLDLVSYAGVYAFAEYLDAMSDANYAEAAAAARRVVARADELLDAPDLAQFQQQLTRLGRGGYEGYALYAEAEVATDDGSWEQATQHLDRAREAFRATVVEAHKMGLPQSRALADQIQNMSAFMLQSARRRSDRERKLRTVITDLERQLRELGEKPRTVLTIQGGEVDISTGDGGNQTNVTNVGGDQTNVTGNLTNVGGDQTNIGGDSVQGDKAGRDMFKSGGVDLQALATQLEELRTHLMNDGSVEAAEAVGGVVEAEKKAKDGDGEGVAAALKKAGKKALEVAREFSLDLIAKVITGVL